MTSASSTTNQNIGKMRSHEITPSPTSTSRSSPQSSVGVEQQAPNWSKIQVLKQRKSDLEKLLNEKNLLLQQIQRQEQQIIAGDFNYDFNHIGNNVTLRRKIGTSFKMPNKNGYTNKELGGSVGDVEKKVRQEIFNATYKLANDQNASKPIRRPHKNEYDAAQQKLIAINHNVNLLKKQQQHQRPPIPSHAEPSAAITLNLTKAPSVVGEHNTTKQCHSATPPSTVLLEPNLLNSNKYGSNNSVNNYYTTERRSSSKSMQSQNSPKQQYDDRSPTVLLKTHRSDYDLTNRLLMATPQNVGIGNGSGYLYDNGEIALLNNNNVIDSGYYNNNSMKFKTSPISNTNSNDGSNRLSTIMTSNMIDALNYYPSQQLHQQSPQQHQLQQQNQYDDAAALYLVHRAYSGGRKYPHGDSIDSISISPSTGVMSTIDRQQAGLGGYWQTLGNERIWCTVDTSYDVSSMQQTGKLKKANTIATTPTKSLSLGNFDIISGKDELGDKISISSMNSENTKKQKEKLWLETSLDGPLIKTKHQTSASSLSPTHQNHSHSIKNHHYNTAIVNNHSHKHNNSSVYYRDRSKLSSQSISSTVYHIPKLEDQQYLSHSTSTLHNGSSGPIVIGETGASVSSSHPINYHHHHHHQNLKQSSTLPIITIQQQQQPISSLSSQPLSIASSITSSSPPPIPPQSSASMLLKQQSHSHQQHQSYHQSAINPRSPIIANLTHHDSIRIESPKNMTVIQQAVFMPYKEITKPFEMSDFYKYSTKFRQKEKQQQQLQQQQQVEVEQ